MPQDFQTIYFNTSSGILNSSRTNETTTTQNEVSDNDEEEDKNDTSKDKELVTHEVDPEKLIEIPDKYNPVSVPSSSTISSNNATSAIPLHESFTSLHGFIKTDPQNIITNNYIADDTRYQTIADNLSKFCRVLSRLKFNFKVTQGDTNLSQLASKLKINALIPSKEQIKEAANRVIAVFDLNKDKRNLDIKSIEKILYQELYDIITRSATDSRTHDVIYNTGDALDKSEEEEKERNIDSSDNEIAEENNQMECVDSDNRAIGSQHISHSQDIDEAMYPFNSQFFSRSISDPDGSNEDEMFTMRLGKWYKWKERISDFGEQIVEEALDKLLKDSGNSKITDDMQERDDLKARIIRDYEQSQCKNANEFAKNWIQKRNASKLPNELTYTVKSITVLKYTIETLKCLLCTILDYPDATVEERRFYLNNYGPNRKKNISRDTVRNIMDKMNVTIQTPSFSPVQRNSLGFCIARVLWANVIKNIKIDPNVLLCFVDEASVAVGKRNKAYGFCSIRPCVNTSLRSKSLSVLSCVIPNIGPICRWFKGAVHNDQYAQFLKDIVFVMRAFICNEHTQLCIIQDNCAIHKTKKVYEMAKLLKINLINTVPYSPQLNLPAENMFAQLKNNSLYKFKAKEVEVFDTQPVTRHFKMSIVSLIDQWDEYMKTSYTYQSTANVFGAWLKVLEECSEGNPLTGLHYSAREHFVPESVHSPITIRRIVQRN